MNDLSRMDKAASKHKRRRWQALRVIASSPAFSVEETEGKYFVVGDSRTRVAGPLDSNADAWTWIDHHMIARRYGS